MEKITKKTTKITESTLLELTSAQVADALCNHFGMAGAEVEFDVRQDYFHGASILLLRVTESSD